MLFSCLLLLLASLDLCLARSYFISSQTMIRSRVKRQAPSAEEPKITEMLISSKVKSRFATVKVSSKMVNSKEDGGLEATFSVQIPESAFIANFTMIINGTTYIAPVNEKKIAQEKYDQAKYQGQTAGQVKHQRRDKARGMDVFNVNVNVAAMSDVYFEMVYQELLERRLGLYQQKIIVQPMQIVDNLTLDLTYDEPQTFDRFSYKEPNSTEVRVTSSDNSVLLASPSTRKIVYRPSASRQREINAEKGIDGEFSVSYDVGHAFNGGNIIYASGNNYFVHYFAIDESVHAEAIPKNIMFVIDISGSMNGRKIEQTRVAMVTIIRQLRNVDYFNIMIFDGSTEMWQTNPVRATSSNINLAEIFVRELRALGGTNINSALSDSVLAVVNDPERSGKAGIIVFLTDGRPTSGVTDLEEITQTVKQLNGNRVAIFTLGFGLDVDFEFLQQISWENGGFARRIYEEVDAADQLTTFFREVNIPLLLDVQFKYLPSQVNELSITRTQYKQVFSGTEIVVAGKRLGSKIDASVIGSTATNAITLVVPEDSKTQIDGPSGEFTEKLWAYLTIKDLLRKKAIAGTVEEAKDFEARALQMSLDYNFVTPLTSLVIVQEDNSQDFEEKEYGQMNVNGQWKNVNGQMKNVKRKMNVNGQMIKHMKNDNRKMIVNGQMNVKRQMHFNEQTNVYFKYDSEEAVASLMANSSCSHFKTPLFYHFMAFLGVVISVKWIW